MPDRPRDIEQRAQRFFHAAADLLGPREAEGRRDDDRGVRMTVIDLTAEDVASLESLAARVGLTGWLRIEAADPAHLRAWATLRRDLVRLRDQHPGVLMMSPGTKGAYRRPPVEIDLAATLAGQEVAADLHARYGRFVALTVGALPYPSDRPGVRQPPPLPAVPAREPVDPRELSVSLNGPLTVRSGETVTHRLVLTNHGDGPVVVLTNGDVTAAVVDPVTGDVVGGFSGFHTAPLVTFQAEPEETIRIPLLVGTTSLTPTLGYAIPPGAWQLVAHLDLRGRRLVSAPLDFTVVP